MAGNHARPGKGTVTGRVWEIADQITAQSGRLATRQEVWAIYQANGGQESTCRTQFSRWKAAHLGQSAASPQQMMQENAKLSAEVAIVTASPDTAAPSPDQPKPKWDVLLKNGFNYHADWTVDDQGRLLTDRKAADDEGVYIFVVGEEVVYVGVSSKLSRRMGNYRLGNTNQSTSHHINGRLLAELKDGKVVRVLTAVPGKMRWNGFDVHVSWGLERALISLFQPAWNRRY